MQKNIEWKANLLPTFSSSCSVPSPENSRTHQHACMYSHPSSNTSRSIPTKYSVLCLFPLKYVSQSFFQSSTCELAHSASCLDFHGTPHLHSNGFRSGMLVPWFPSPSHVLTSVLHNGPGWQPALRVTDKETRVTNLLISLGRSGCSAESPSSPENPYPQANQRAGHLTGN